MGNASQYGKSIYSIQGSEADKIEVPGVLNGNQFLRAEWQAMAAENGAMTALAQAYAQLHEGHKALAEQMRTSRGGRSGPYFLDLKAKGDKWLDNAGKSFERASQRAKIELNSMRMRVETELGIGRDNLTPYASPIRDHVRNLPDAQRMEFLNRVVEESDAQAAAALLDAPSYLSGLTSEQKDGFRMRYLTKHDPKGYASMKAIAEALDTTNNALSAAVVFHSQLFPSQRVEAETAARKRQQELDAKLTVPAMPI